MIVGLMSRRCFHCVEIDQFTGPQHVADHLNTLTGTPCPLCGTVIQKGDVDIAIDPESIEQIKDGRSTWNPGDIRPAAFSRFFTGADQGRFGEVASKLIGRVDAASRSRRRASCEAGTAVMIPMLLSYGSEAMEAGDTERAIRVFQVCVERGDERCVTTASFNLGHIEYQRENFKAALPHFEQAARTTDTMARATALFFHAMSLHGLDDRKGALRGYQRSVECGESPVFGMAGYRLGMLLEFFGERSGARAAYETLVDRRDGNDSTKAALKLAVLEDEDGRWARVKELSEYAFTSPSEETRTVAAYNLGRVAEVEGHIRRARKFYRIAGGSPHQEAAQRARERLADLG
jgi:hypothetical protein